MRQFFGYTVKRIQNISPSRIDMFTRCVTSLFYLSMLRITPPFPSHPSSLHGNGLHKVNELLALKMWKEGALDLEVKDEVVKNYVNYVMAVMTGAEVLPGKPVNSIEWLAPWEKVKTPEEQQQIIQKKLMDYRFKSQSAIEAIYYLFSRGTKAVELQAEKDFFLHIPSTINPQMRVPIKGTIDLSLGFASGRKVVIDWKTGKRSYITHEKLINHVQMLVYKRAIWEETGIVPETFIVSQEVFMNDLKSRQTVEEKQLMLMKKPFLIPVPVSYEEQWPELQQLVSEIWYVLMHLIYPPESKIAREKIKLWRPISAVGKQLHLEQHLQQDRPVPNITKNCDICSAKSLCQKDNALDWEVHEKQLQRASLDRVTTRSDQQVRKVISQTVPAAPFNVNLHLFEGAPLSPDEKRVQKKYGRYNWPELGYEKVRTKSDRRIKWLWKLMPRHWTGALCPCVQGKWFWKKLLELYPAIKLEEEEYKDEQRRKRDADPELKGTKLKSLRRSIILENELEQCPVQNCEHQCNPNPKLRESSLQIQSLGRKG